MRFVENAFRWLNIGNTLLRAPAAETGLVELSSTGIIRSWCGGTFQFASRFLLKYVALIGKGTLPRASAAS